MTKLHHKKEWTRNLMKNVRREIEQFSSLGHYAVKKRTTPGWLKSNLHLQSKLSSFTILGESIMKKRYYMVDITPNKGYYENSLLLVTSVLNIPHVGYATV